MLLFHTPLHSILIGINPYEIRYAENGSLGQTLKAFGKLNEKLVATYVVKILEGLERRALQPQGSEYPDYEKRKCEALRFWRVA